MFFEYEDWPDALREVALNVPVAVFELEPAAGAGWQVPATAQWPQDAPPLLFAKLGAKSWRNSRSVGPMPGEALVLERAVQQRLRRPTQAQIVLTDLMQDAGVPVRLYLFEWIDMRAISEVRLACSPDGFRIVSALERGAAVADYGADIVGLAEMVYFALQNTEPPLDPDPEQITLDVAICGLRGLRLVDVNPAEPGIRGG